MCILSLNILCCFNFRKEVHEILKMGALRSRVLALSALSEHASMFAVIVTMFFRGEEITLVHLLLLIGLFNVIHLTLFHIGLYSVLMTSELMGSLKRIQV